LNKEGRKVWRRGDYESLGGKRSTSAGMGVEKKGGVSEAREKYGC